MTVAAVPRREQVRLRLARWGVPAGALVVEIVAVAAELAGADRPTPPAIGAYLAAALTSAVLVVRARWPVATAVAILLICLGYHLVGYPGQGPAFALFVVVFVLPSRGRLVGALGTAVAVCVVWSVIPALPPHPTSWLDSAVLGPAIGMVVVAVVGAIVVVSARQAAAEHAALVAETRASVARDIHDVLAHTIAAVTVQANLALDAVDDDPVTAKAAIRRARDLARAATPQLRHSLLQLRDDGRPQPPQPTLALVERVLDDARAAGFRVHARIPSTGPVDPIVELTVARIVQEAVTNVIRHSDGRRLDCTVGEYDGEWVTEIIDDGTRTPGPEGLGSAGMRERVAAVGGRLDFGAVPGGYRVRASIPSRPR